MRPCPPRAPCHPGAGLQPRRCDRRPALENTAFDFVFQTLHTCRQRRQFSFQSRVGATQSFNSHEAIAPPRFFVLFHATDRSGGRVSHGAVARDLTTRTRVVGFRDDPFPVEERRSPRFFFRQCKPRLGLAKNGALFVAPRRPRPVQRQSLALPPCARHELSPSHAQVHPSAPAPPPGRALRPWIPIGRERRPFSRALPPKDSRERRVLSDAPRRRGPLRRFDSGCCARFV